MNKLGKRQSNKFSPETQGKAYRPQKLAPTMTPDMRIMGQVTAASLCLIVLVVLSLINPGRQYTIKQYNTPVLHSANYIFKESQPQTLGLNSTKPNIVNAARMLNNNTKVFLKQQFLMSRFDDYFLRIRARVTPVRQKGKWEWKLLKQCWVQLLMVTYSQTGSFYDRTKRSIQLVKSWRQRKMVPTDLLMKSSMNVSRARNVYWIQAWTHHEKLKHPEVKKLSIINKFLHHTALHLSIYCQAYTAHTGPECNAGTIPQNMTKHATYTGYSLNNLSPNFLTNNIVLLAAKSTSLKTFLVSKYPLIKKNKSGMQQAKVAMLEQKEEQIQELKAKMLCAPLLHRQKQYPQMMKGVEISLNVENWLIFVDYYFVKRSLYLRPIEMCLKKPDFIGYQQVQTFYSCCFLSVY